MCPLKVNSEQNKLPEEGSRREMILIMRVDEMLDDKSAVEEMQLRGVVMVHDKMAEPSRCGLGLHDHDIFSIKLAPWCTVIRVKVLL